MRIKDKYINPFTDFGFKKLFGTDWNFGFAEDQDDQDIFHHEVKLVNQST